MSHTVPPATPARIAAYEVVRAIGRGGSGTVFEARGPTGAVAVKLFSDVDATTTKRFAEELEAMKRVSHPALIEVLDHGTHTTGQHFLVMPLLSGETLHDRALQKPLRVSDALEVLSSLAGAVACLHDHGLVHRDIKPENVFLPERGGAILLDLGLAREAFASESTTTQKGVVRGTPAYMAPERFFGARATPRSDVYELAVTFYFALTGLTPWATEEPEDRLCPTPPSRHNADISGELERAILASLSTRTDARPASARALLRSFSEAASAQGAARATTTQDVLVRTPIETGAHESRRGPRTWALAGALTIVAVGAGGLGLIRSGAPSPPPGGGTHALMPEAAARASSPEPDSSATQGVLARAPESTTSATLPAGSGRTLASALVKSAPPPSNGAIGSTGARPAPPLPPHVPPPKSTVPYYDDRL